MHDEDLMLFGGLALFAVLLIAGVAGGLFVGHQRKQLFGAIARRHGLELRTRGEPWNGTVAIGDVSGAPMLAHKASKEGEVCAEVIAGKPAAKDWATIPGIVFTDPEIATVGLTEAQAKAEGIEVKVGKFPFAALGRAMSIRETDGFVKVLTDTQSKRIVGIHIAGPSASDLISEAALALEMVATAEDMAMTVHPHPTLGEALMEASAHSLGHAIHTVNR